VSSVRRGVVDGSRVRADTRNTEMLTDSQPARSLCLWPGLDAAVSPLTSPVLFSGVDRNLLEEFFVGS
jgi:hypothetical protein